MRAARVDQNQKDVIAEIRSALKGCTVTDLSAVGKGMPDIIIGWKNRNWLIEIKNPKQKPSDRKLSDAQVRWHGKWAGQAHVAHSASEAIAVIAETLQHER